MAPPVIRAADLRLSPWANGAGTTREIAAAGHDSASQAAGRPWRVSLALIEQDGPFSHLPSLTRTLLCVGPAPLRLEVDGKARTIEPLDVLRFDGGATVRCAVPEPTLALNAMVDRSRRPADIRVLRPSPQDRPVAAAQGPCLVVALDGEVEIDDGDGPVRLAQFDTARIDHRAVTVRGGGTVATVELP